MKLEALTEYEVLAVNKPHTLYVSLEVGSREEIEVVARPPLGVLFLLDTSSSMEGAPLEAAMASIREVCAMLGEEDRVGLINFEAMATREVPFELYSEAHRALLDRKLDAITPKPGTNIGDALVLARGVLAAGDREGERVVVLLLSDGVPSCGEREPKALAQCSRFIGKKGSLSTLGFGRTSRSPLLESMAEAARGAYFSVDAPVTRAWEYSCLLDSRRRGSWTDLSITLVPRDGVRIHRVHGARDVNVQLDGRIEVQLPEVVRDTCVRVLLEVTMDACARVGPRTLLDARVSGQDPARGACAMRVSVAEVMIGQQTGERAAPVLVDMFLFHVRQRRRALAMTYESSCGTAYELLKDLLEQARRLSAKDLEDKGRRRQLERVRASLEEDVALVRGRAREEILHHAFEARRRARVSGPMLVCYIYQLRLDIPAPITVSIATTTDMLAIGRTRGADVRLDDDRLSRRHARVFLEGATAWIQDLGSTNGTCVGDDELDPGRPRELDPGACVRLTSRTWMWVRVCERGGAMAPERRHVLERLGRALDPEERRLLDGEAYSALFEIASPMAAREAMRHWAGITLATPKEPRHDARELTTWVRTWREGAPARPVSTSALFGEVRALEHAAPEDRTEMLSHLGSTLSHADRSFLGLECHAAMGHITQLADHSSPAELGYLSSDSADAFPESHECALLWLAEQALVRRACVGDTPLFTRMNYERTLVTTLSSNLLTEEELREVGTSDALLEPLFDASCASCDDGERSEQARVALDEARSQGALHVLFRRELKWSPWSAPRRGGPRTDQPHECDHGG